MKVNRDNIILVIIVILILILISNNYYEKFEEDTIHPMNKYFDSVNIISVPSRKTHINKFIKKIKIKANIIDATLVKDIDYDKLLEDNFISEKYYLKKNKGRIACHYSQIKLLQNFVKSNDNTIFIFEDDISLSIPKNYKNIIDESMKNIPKDWDIVFFGRCWDNCNIKKKIKGNLYRVYEPKCRHAYGLTKKGAMKILKYTLPMTNNGDSMYSNNIKNGNIIAYAIHPTIFNQNRINLGSNIGNNITINKRISIKFNNFFRKKIIYPPVCI